MLIIDLLENPVYENRIRIGENDPFEFSFPELNEGIFVFDLSDNNQREIVKIIISN